MQDKAETSPKQRLGRRVALVILLSGMVIMVIFLILAPFLQRLVRSEQAAWPVPRHTVTVDAADLGCLKVFCTQSAHNS